jgi:hypothetical protein
VDSFRATLEGETAREAIMTEFQLGLSPEERQYLADLLKAVLKDTRVEEHRTRTPLYRESIVHNETLIVDLLQKLGQRPE